VRPIVPIPGLDARKVELGRALFADARLSDDDTISCASCHVLSAGGADGRRVSVGVRGATGTLNAPTVLNAALDFRQFRDGRVDSLEEQIDGPVTAEHEMASSWPQVVARLAGDPDMAQRFSAIYSDGISQRGIRDAIATFERSLVTPDSRFDRFLRGESGAIGAPAREGYRLFKIHGCVACHQGVNLGGNLYQKFGVMRPYYDASRPARVQDLGRFNLTGLPEHRHEFKVPGLRNVALTAPYLHDGSVASLAEALRLMARHQLGFELPDDDVTRIMAFLESLTGTLDGKPL
jgi:cytochrome c peroxidase